MFDRAFHFLFFAALPALAILCVALGARPAVAAEAQQMRRVFVPAPPKGKGDKCVADTDFMRRNHMTMLDHQRDETVEEGIRVNKFSLKKCVSCHAVKGPDARPLTIKSPKHFCRVCHDYAAVKMDCFECHASRPGTGKAAGFSLDEQQRNALASYLEEQRP